MKHEPRTEANDMKRKTSTLILLGVLSLGSLAWQPAPASAFPEPNLAYHGWEFQFKHSDPRAILVPDANGEPRWYWYITYKVVNNSNQEHLFIPEITISTEAGDILTANQEVSPRVFAAIKEETGNRLLVSPIRVVGKLLVGEDQARESVAVWPAFDHGVTEVNIFFAGLSGEAQTYKNPVSGESINIKRTLMINYKTPGSNSIPSTQTVIPVHERWVMR